MNETMIGSAGDVIELPAGRVLTEQGRIGHEFVLLLEGEAAVERDGETIGTVGPGDFVGEIALLTRSRRTATVRTTTPVKAVVVGEREFRGLAATDREFSAEVWRAAAQRLAG
jgi:CRP-like cAMP-binding protein